MDTSEKFLFTFLFVFPIFVWVFAANEASVDAFDEIGSNGWLAYTAMGLAIEAYLLLYMVLRILKDLYREYTEVPAVYL